MSFLYYEYVHTGIQHHKMSGQPNSIRMRSEKFIKTKIKKKKNEQVEGKIFQKHQGNQVEHPIRQMKRPKKVWNRI